MLVCTKCNSLPALNGRTRHGRDDEVDQKGDWSNFIPSPFLAPNQRGSACRKIEGITQARKKVRRPTDPAHCIQISSYEGDPFHADGTPASDVRADVPDVTAPARWEVLFEARVKTPRQCLHHLFLRQSPPYPLPAVPAANPA
ncbi:MAG: hypothetical protein FRX49_00128 [Trebouxia sp. A1-2]|nr:MAG: hypothetical protein FRX49_00128 [Trebouxia sp. A1-2]